MYHINQRKVFIFDPCFGGMTGHWENYCKRLYQELLDRHCDLIVYGHTEFDDRLIKGVNFKPLFSRSPYVDMRNMVEFNQQVNFYLKDLNKIDIAEFNDGDLIIFHSIFPQIFSAIIKWTQVLVKQKKVTVTILFQFPPSHAKEQASVWRAAYKRLKRFLLRLPPEMDWVDNNYVRFYRKDIDDLCPLIKDGTVLLFGNTDVLSINFSLLLGLPVHYMPMPGQKLTQLMQQQETVTVEKPSVIKVGYFGHSALEKGGQFLRYIVEKALACYPNVEFILHINPNPSTEAHLSYFKTQSNPRVTCHFGHLDPAMMMHLMSQVDIILMPYSPEKYATTPSAVFTEGMPLQKIFIIPKNTWVYNEAKKHDAGYACFEKYDVISITKAFFFALNNYVELRKKSYRAGLAFYNENNMVNYIDIFIKTIANIKQEGTRSHEELV